jgi:hypothetical protein
MPNPVEGKGRDGALRHLVSPERLASVFSEEELYGAP